LELLTIYDARKCVFFCCCEKWIHECLCTLTINISSRWFEMGRRFEATPTKTVDLGSFKGYKLVFRDNCLIQFIDDTIIMDSQKKQSWLEEAIMVFLNNKFYLTTKSLLKTNRGQWNWEYRLKTQYIGGTPENKHPKKHPEHNTHQNTRHHLNQTPSRKRPL